MKSVSILCTVLAALSFAAGIQASENPVQPAVALFLDFEYHPLPVVVSSMEAEVDRILSPSGLHFEWHMLHADGSVGAFADLAVAHFKGSCTVRSDPLASRHPLESVVLATTAISDGHVLPFTEVECEILSRYLGPQILAFRGKDRDLLMGRAMGRVLAHELYHIFCETRKHGTSGVASAYHTRSQLLATEFNFSEVEGALLRDYQSRISLPSTPVPSREAGVAEEVPAVSTEIVR